MPSPFQPARKASPNAFLERQRLALAQLAAGTSLSSVLDELVRDEEEDSAIPVRMSIHFLDADEKRLLQQAAPSLPHAYRQAVDVVEIGPAAGSCGTAAYRREPVYVADIDTDPGWAAYRDVALAHGLKACWSTPIRGLDGRLLGTLASYYMEPRSPTAEDTGALAALAQTVAFVVEWHRSDHALKAAEGRHRQIFNSAIDVAIIGTDLGGQVTDWNEGARRVLGWTEEEMLGQPLHRIFTPEDVANQRPETEMRCAVAQGYSPDERWHLRKSGERLWAVGQLTPLKDDGGEVIGFIKIMQDRTGQKHADERLQQLTAALENKVAQRTRERDRIWHNSMDLLLVIGPEGKLRAVNPAVTVLLGYRPGELVGNHYGPFVHPDDIESTVNAIATASREPLLHFEMRVRHKDGTYRWIAWRAVPEDGMVYATGRDVTAQKRQAQHLMQANEAQLNLALEAGEMGAWEWHPKTDAVRWLDGAAVLHGVHASAEHVSLSMEDYMRRFVHPDDWSALADAITRAVAEGDNHRAEYRILRPDGSVHWLEARGRMLFDEAGKPSQMIGLNVDITRRKRNEQDLRFLARASAELARLVDPQSTLDRLAFLAVPHFADWCAIDLLQEDGTLKRVAVAHVQPDKVRLAHEFHRRFPPDPNLPVGIWNVLRTGRSEMISEVTGELLARTITDPERLAIMKDLGFRSYMAVPLSAHGKTMGVVAFFGAESGRLFGSDDLALAEDLAHRAAIAIENATLYRTLREADQAKNVFLATLSHELRNPLAAIVNGLGLLTMTMDDRTRIEKYATLMQRQATQLTRLIDDLMDVARITTGKVGLKKELTSLAAIVDNAIETSRPDIGAGQHHLSVSLPNEPTELVADPVRLSQVISNLLNNAAKYTPPGGRIEVVLACSPEEYTVRVRDTGVGISADMLKKVFSMFTQATHPIQRSKGGLGIGLALVDGLVKLHGGRVEAFSGGTGQGSEFVVHLPRESGEDSSIAGFTGPATDTHEKRKVLRVLVVDDNIDAATTVADILRVLGHQVETVHDGLAAVAAAAAIQPDVILLDIGLPGIDGYEAARRIRSQDGRVRPALLIALTGWGQEHDKRRAYDAGFDQHWVKPVGLEKLKSIF